MDRKAHRRIAVFAAFLLMAAALPSWAGNGKISGVVLDKQTSEPLVRASVTVEGTKPGTVTGNDGRFFILDVPPGQYSLRVTYIGYAPYIMTEVQVNADLTTKVQAKATPEAIQAAETVVRAERPIIDKNATNAVRIVGAEDLEILPFRGVQNVFALQAGVVEDEGALHIRGSRSDEIAYYVEGASVRNVVTGNTAVTLIDEALEEVQLQAGGFNAEYGGANAGVILQELRTGGTDLEVGVLTETDGFASKGETFLGAHSYGYSNSVLTLSGPVAGNDRIRAFVASQRRALDSQPIFWDGFEFNNLVDTGDSGGQRHWRRDADGNAIPDTVESIRGLDGFVPHTGSEAIDLNGTLLFDFEPIKVQVTGLWSDESLEMNVAPIRNLFSQERLSEAERSSSLINVKATHLLDPSMFYEINVSSYRQDREISDPTFGDNWWVYNDSFAVANANEKWVGAYSNVSTNPNPYNLAGFEFNRPGTPTNYISGSDRGSWFIQEDDRYWGVAGSLTKQSDVHELKVGFDYQRWTSRRYSLLLNSIRSGIKNTYPTLDAVYGRYYAGEISEDQILDELLAQAEANPAGAGNLQELKALMRNTSRSDFFGYDEFGRESDGSGLDAPRHPVLASAFLQDKIEYDDLIVNAGVRIDYFDVDSWRFKDPAAPVLDNTNYSLDTSVMAKTRTFTEISPRLGFSFPVSERTVFHVQYGRFSQMPRMREMFTGGARLALELGGQNLINNPSAFDIEPMRTTQYEIGFERQFSKVASFDITGFYRDVKGQIQIARQDISQDAIGANSYNYYQNGDFATTKGLELVFKLRRTNRLRSEFYYTLSDARGTGSTTASGLSGVENDTNLPTVISPLDFNETHRGAIYLDYRFGENDGGKVLSQLGTNLLFRFTSGHNFTYSTGGLGQTLAMEGGILNSTDPRNRKPLEAVNSSTTPWTFQIDLKVDKGFDLFGLDAKLYGYVENLLDRQNVTNVYSRTGNAEDDGFLTDPSLSAEIIQNNGGLQYQQMYQAINIANRQHYWINEGGDIYDEPRQIRFGISLGI